MTDQQKLFEDIRVEAIAISASGLRLSAYADKLSESDNPICQYHAPKVKKAAGDGMELGSFLRAIQIFLVSKTCLLNQVGGAPNQRREDGRPV